MSISFLNQISYKLKHGDVGFVGYDSRCQCTTIAYRGCYQEGSHAERLPWASQ